MSPGDTRLETVRQCRKARYHGALLQGDFTAAPRQLLKNTQVQTEKVVYLSANSTTLLTTASSQLWSFWYVKLNYNNKIIAQ